MTTPTTTAPDTTGAQAHAELLRALGAAVLTAPPHGQHIYEALALAPPSVADHTDTFVLNLPPHAAIHLGPEGKLGGEGLDRVAGFWRVLGLTPPSDADHLGVLLLLYAAVDEGERTTTSPRTRAMLANTRQAMFAEHLWTWAPGYLDAVIEEGSPAIAAWAQLTLDALGLELRCAAPDSRLPLALRSAPAPLSSDASLDEVLDACVAPIRSGVLLTHHAISECAATVGAGMRRGERRYALKFLIQQDARATLGWLASYARDWSRRHAARADPVSAWWADRAGCTARMLAAVADEDRADGSGTGGP